METRFSFCKETSEESELKETSWLNLTHLDEMRDDVDCGTHTSMTCSRPLMLGKSVCFSTLLSSQIYLGTLSVFFW